MKQAENVDSARKPDQKSEDRIMSHERERTHKSMRSLYAVLTAAEADIIARKGPDWNKAARA